MKQRQKEKSLFPNSRCLSLETVLCSPFLRYHQKTTQHKSYKQWVILYSFIFPNVARQRRFKEKCEIYHLQSRTASRTGRALLSLALTSAGEVYLTAVRQSVCTKLNSKPTATQTMPFGSSWNPSCCSQAQQKHFDQLENTDTIGIYIITTIIVMII